MFCRKCGIRIDINTTFCPECGEKVNIDKKSSPLKGSAKTLPEAPETSVPFREDFYHHIKGFLFFLTVLLASVYYGVNVLNSIRHFSSSDIFISVMSLIYGLIATGLIVPSMWMIYSDRSPHTAFVPIKLYGFVNILKVFLMTAFGVLAVLGAVMGKNEIPKNILYLADENISVYILTLLSQTARNPSLLLISTSSILLATYLAISLTYHISLIQFLNSLSKRIYDNSTVPKGYTAISCLSFFISVVSFLYSLSMYLFLKYDIYNVLLTAFKGMFHLMVFIDLRKFGKMFADENQFNEECEEQ